MSAHDRHLAGYSASNVQVWCSKRDCPNHQGTTVKYEKEYGQGWLTPEECWICKSDWLNDEPTDEEEEDDGAD
jgi:hypothetical protein